MRQRFHVLTVADRLWVIVDNPRGVSFRFPVTRASAVTLCKALHKSLQGDRQPSRQLVK